MALLHTVYAEIRKKEKIFEREYSRKRTTFIMKSVVLENVAVCMSNTILFGKYVEVMSRQEWFL